MSYNPNKRRGVSGYGDPAARRVRVTAPRVILAAPVRVGRPTRPRLPFQAAAPVAAPRVATHETTTRRKYTAKNTLAKHIQNIGRQIASKRSLIHVLVMQAAQAIKQDDSSREHILSTTKQPASKRAEEIESQIAKANKELLMLETEHSRLLYIYQTQLNEGIKACLSLKEEASALRAENERLKVKLARKEEDLIAAYQRNAALGLHPAETDSSEALGVSDSESSSMNDLLAAISKS